MALLLQDGAYRAKMTGAQVKLSAKGTPYLTFLWKTEQGVELKSFFFLTDKSGGPNENGKTLVRKWCPNWDGGEYWFNEHFDEVSKIAVILIVKNEPSYKDPSQIYPVVKWVNPIGGQRDLQRGSGVPTASEECDATASQPTPPDPANRAEFASYLDQLTPMMADAWAAINILYRGKSAAFVEKAWFSIIDTYSNGKDQDQFTEAQWQSVINHMKGL